jgi:transcriptional regulator GlxA family with amidase domain
MHVVFALYEAVTALDLVGPYQVFSVAPDVRVTLAASERGPKRTDSGMIIHAERALRDVSDADLIVVPGTGRPDVPLADEALLAWLRDAGPKARWTCSVCTGSLLLGAAGLLRGRRATTHWLAHNALRDFGAEPVHERVVFDGNIVTAAGVSAGIDMALTVLARVAGESTARAVQLGIEYDPQPPFQIGSAQNADPQLVDLATRLLTEAAAKFQKTPAVIP